MLTSSKLDKPSMQARKSGHTTHHSGNIARTEWFGPMRRTHRASTHAASADVCPSVAPYFSLFRCDPARSKNYLPFGELFADGFLVQFVYLHVPRTTACLNGNLLLCLQYL